MLHRNWIFPTELLLSPRFSDKWEVKFSQAVLTENSFESKNPYHIQKCWAQIGKGVNDNQND